MEKIKENATKDFLEMIKKSWTWARLTEEEKAQFMTAWETVTISWANNGDSAVKGTYKDRWQTCNAMYHMFLAGVGYDTNKEKWK